MSVLNIPGPLLTGTWTFIALTAVAMFLGFVSRFRGVSRENSS